MLRLWHFLEDNLWIVVLPVGILIAIGCSATISEPPPNDVWRRPAGNALVSIDGETHIVASAACSIVPNPRHHLTENDHYLTIECRKAHFQYDALFHQWDLLDYGAIVFSGTGSSVWFQNNADD